MGNGPRRFNLLRVGASMVLATVCMYPACRALIASGLQFVCGACGAEVCSPACAVLLVLCVRMARKVQYSRTNLCAMCVVSTSYLHERKQNETQIMLRR